MPIGATVRRMFGPFERPVADLYRACFVDLDMQIAQLKTWRPDARSILEIGCGEGAITQKLVAAYPDAHITGIDITPRAGRLFDGPRDRVQFRCMTAAALAAESPAAFDLVLIFDVLHHVPWDLHEAILADARTLLAPGGTFVLKEWELIRNLGHVLCAFSDRVLTGDDVKFGEKPYFEGLLERSFGGGSVAGSARIRPWPNNLMVQCRPAPAKEAA
jgi:SAM-dependent methyltransferase